jgi:hypothetical protein
MITPNGTQPVARSISAPIEAANGRSGKQPSDDKAVRRDRYAFHQGAHAANDRPQRTPTADNADERGSTRQIHRRLSTFIGGSVLWKKRETRSVVSEQCQRLATPLAFPANNLG